MEENFPQYLLELRGLGDGADIPFDELFLFNLEVELTAELERHLDPTIDKGCSSVLVNNGECLVWGHNEDQDPECDQHDFLLCAQIDPFTDGRGRHYPAESFVTHVVPGKMPGRSFNFNSHGFVYSQNIVFVPFPETAQKPVARSMLLRHLMAAKSVQDAEERVLSCCTGVPLVGININAGELSCPDKLWSLEIGPDYKSNRVCTSLKVITQESSGYGHFNGFQHLPVPFTQFENSERRRLRYAKLPKAESAEDILCFLGDEEDTEHSVFQRGTRANSWQTTCTALFDMKARTLSIYKGNPRNCTTPLVSLSMDLVKGL